MELLLGVRELLQQVIEAPLLLLDGLPHLGHLLLKRSRPVTSGTEHT